MGVANVSLQRRSHCYLFMDDTTLLAKTPNGLSEMIAAHMNFCQKFRMRLNVKKSKLMRFTRNGDDTLQLNVNGCTFSTPKKGKPTDRCVHSHLGFLCESDLSGDAHLDRALNRAQAKRHTVNTVAKSLGEPLALHYLRTVVSPQVLYATEMLHKDRVGGKLDKAWTALVAECVGVGRLSRRRSMQPHVRRDALMMETRELPWEIEHEKRVLGLWRRLAHAPSMSLTCHMITGHHADGNWGPVSSEKLIAHAHRIAAKWQVRPAMHGKHAWKRVSRDAAQSLVGDRVASLRVDLGRSDCMYISTMVGDEARRWSALLPSCRLRVALRRLKLGMIPHLKKTMSKCMPANVGCAWRLLSDATQADLLQCQCGCGEQNAGHVWHQCMYTDHMRIAVVDAATRVVDDLASARDRAWWHGLDAAECVAHVVSSQCVMDDVTRQRI